MDRQPSQSPLSHWRVVMRDGTALPVTLARLLPAGAIAMVVDTVSLAFTDQAGAQTATWTGTTSSDFDTAANWSPAAVPNSPNAAGVFGPTGNATVSAGSGNARVFKFTAGNFRKPEPPRYRN